MSEFSSLNGYDVKDKVARNIAKGRNQAIAFENYSEMVTALNSLEKGEYNVGQNIYIVTVGVPDLWVSSVEDIVHNFDYVSDEDIAQKLNENGTIQCGYYRLSMLEGQKVDLTTYDEAISKLNSDLDLSDSYTYIPLTFSSGANTSGAYLCFMPLLNADQYDITITRAVVVGAGSVSSSVSITNQSKIGFVITSNGEVGGKTVNFNFTVAKKSN